MLVDAKIGASSPIMAIVNQHPPAHNARCRMDGVWKGTILNLSVGFRV
jgi:hypothetical protein